LSFARPGDRRATSRTSSPRRRDKETDLSLRGDELLIKGGKAVDQTRVSYTMAQPSICPRPRQSRNVGVRVSNVSLATRSCARECPMRSWPDTFETRNTRPSRVESRDASPIVGECNPNASAPMASRTVSERNRA
jgi:hypothetical protein